MKPNLAVVGFGTGGLIGSACYDSVLAALKAGFRCFDTAETEIWYDQESVANAFKTFVSDHRREKVRSDTSSNFDISTKIPPWELTSFDHIRYRASESRQLLLGYFDIPNQLPHPLDIYYIHAPDCSLWKGWHPRCDNPPEILSLREAWLAMEAVVGLDRTARRIGLSNITPNQLNDVIKYVEERSHETDAIAPPRLPDVIQCYADPLQPSRELRSICKLYGIEFVSYSTLGYRHILKNQSKVNPVLNHPIIKDIAKRHGKGEILIVLAWATQIGMSVIPRSSNKQHINELSQLLNDPPVLSPGDLELIDTMCMK